MPLYSSYFFSSALPPFVSFTYLLDSFWLLGMIKLAQSSSTWQPLSPAPCALCMHWNIYVGVDEKCEFVIR